MTVRVTPLNILGVIAGAPAGTTALQFKDTFQRANNQNIGLYSFNFMGSGNTPFTIAAAINANKLRFTQNNTGAGSSVLSPLVMAWMGTKTQSQFSEVTFSAASSTIASSLTAACVINPNCTNANSGLYGLTLSPVSGTLAIARIIYNASYSAQLGSTTLNNLGNTVTVVSGDVLRLQALWNGTQWTLNAFKNGTLLGSATDSNFTLGYPGLLIGAAAQSSTMDISEYACGTQ